MAAKGPKMLNMKNRSLWWVPTIANKKSPLVSEISAGVQLTCLVTIANYQFGITGTNIITDPSPCDGIEAGAPGMDTLEAGFDMFRFKDGVEDIAWTTFTDKGIGGYLVERIGQVEDGEDPSEVPIAVGDEVAVMEVLTLSPRPLSPATAGYEKFHQGFAPQSFEPRAVVAAA